MSDLLKQVGLRLQELQPGDPGNAAEEAAKHSQQESNYVDQAMMCGNCSNYLGDQGPENCALVQGYVEPLGLCQYWNDSQDQQNGNQDTSTMD